MKHHIDHINDIALVGNILMLTINGRQVPVYLNKYSGRAVKRKKVDSVIGIRHTGIWLGKTGDGVDLVAHNHYKVGRPSIATYNQFARGEQVQWDDKEGDRPMVLVLQSAINQIKNRNTYTVLGYNCQHFVNIAVRQKHQSESLRNVAAGLGGVVVATGLLGLLLAGGSNRTL